MVEDSRNAILFSTLYFCVSDADYLSLQISHQKIKTERSPIENIGLVFGPILAIFILVAKDNGSTALMILLVSIIVLIVGQFSKKYIAGFVSVAAVLSVLFILVALNTSWVGGNRIHTWMSRIETFTSTKTKAADVDTEAMKAKNYQVMQAKAAIVHGGITGMGPGKVH